MRVLPLPNASILLLTLILLGGCTLEQGTGWKLVWNGGGMRVEVIELATTLKTRGFQTAIVTNNAREFRENWTKSVPTSSRRKRYTSSG